MIDQPWRRSPEQFAAHVEQSLEWVVAHMRAAGSRSPWSPLQPGELAARLPNGPPDGPVPLEDVLADLQEVIEPGLVRWDAPGWFAWFPSNAHPDAILGDLLASVTAQQGMLWASSPACTELEGRMLEWLRLAMGLPERFAEGGPGGGVIQDTASSGVLACMVAARDRATDGAATQRGAAACGELAVYASEQSHSSVLKAAGICGIGRDHVRLVPTRDDFSMDPRAAAEMMSKDAAAGRRPVFCCATVGTTGCGAVDPVSDLGRICGDHQCWLHVDAAWAGTAALAPELRGPVVAGAEDADSWSFNPHKWMGAAFDCCCLWVADRRPLIDAMSIEPEYLRNSATDSGGVIDYRDWHIQLGRRFRAIKLWLLLRCTGVSAIAEMVRFHVSLAARLEAAVEAHSHLALTAPRSLSLCCVHHMDGDQATQRVIDRVNADGRFAVTHCRLQDRLSMRVAIGTLAVDQDTVDALIEVLEEGDPGPEAASIA
ncbi:MAG: pyridoxal-dependent decarboxylase [Phycisphaerales bacterium]|jgi:aromatic-L-amino-acid decarboxylase|nr:pyridoxal-dependent decarboxylase [Phycisphaerales bacterium]